MYMCVIIIYKHTHIYIHKYMCVWQTEVPTFKTEGNNENLGKFFKSYIFLYQRWTTNLGVFFNTLIFPPDYFSWHFKFSP